MEKFSGSSTPSERVLKRNALFSKPKPVIVPFKNKIVEVSLEMDTELVEGCYVDYCFFEVEEDGYYHLSTQLGIRNESIRDITVNYLMFGIAENSDVANMNDNMISQIINTPCSEGYVISNNLTTINQLAKGVQYKCWLILSADNAGAFNYIKDLSHMRLYKL
jgi:hypothetical protein